VPITHHADPEVGRKNLESRDIANRPRFDSSAGRGLSQPYRISVTTKKPTIGIAKKIRIFRRRLDGDI